MDGCVDGIGSVSRNCSDREEVEADLSDEECGRHRRRKLFQVVGAGLQSAIFLMNMGE